MRGAVRRLNATLFDAGALAAEFAQIVQLGAADAAEALDFDLGDAGAVKGENPLHADAVADLADGEAFADAAVLAGDDDAFEGLKTLAGAFLDLDGNAHGVAGAEGGDFALRLHVFLLNEFYSGIHTALPPCLSGVLSGTEKPVQRSGDQSGARQFSTGSLLGPHGDDAALRRRGAEKDQRGTGRSDHLPFGFHPWDA